MYNAIVIKIEDYIEISDPPQKYIVEYNNITKEFKERMSPGMKKECEDMKCNSPIDIMHKIDDIKQRNMILQSPIIATNSKPKALQDIDKLYESVPTIQPPETKSCCKLL